MKIDLFACRNDQWEYCKRMLVLNYVYNLVAYVVAEPIV